MRVLMMVSLMIISTSAHSSNWRGALISKLQTDNRYTNNASFFGEMIGRFDYEDSRRELQLGADVLLRGGNYGFNDRQDFYRLFVQKGFHSLHTTVKLGRFDQADSLGLYTLNGASALYQAENKQFSVELYGGVPQRFDDLVQVKGDALYGIKANLQKTLDWHSDALRMSLDRMDLRLGYQHFDGQDVSRYVPLRDRQTAKAGGDKLAFGLNLSGTLGWSWAQKYQSRLIGTYRADTNNFEDGQFETEIDVNKRTRLRGVYEYYRPDRYANPTFREQFYSQYGFGRQELLRVSAHQRWKELLDYFVGLTYTTRSIGDSGFGMNGGISARYLGQFKSGLEVDHLEVAGDKVSALYLKNEYQVNSRHNLLLSGALRHEQKALYGDNWVKGVEVRWNMMIKNNLLTSLSVNYIWNTRLQDEYLAAFQVTYYFDNFKPKKRND